MTTPPGQEHDTAVQATNDDAFLSKIAALRVGYFVDDYLVSLQRAYQAEIPLAREESFKRPPVINRGTFARVLLKNTLIDAFIAQTSSGVKQIVSLGAGFDTCAFTLLETTSTCIRFLELDFRDVVQQKIRLAKEILSSSLFSRTTIGTDHVTCSTNREKPMSSYALRACDLRDITALQGVLMEAGIDPSAPTLILAEIVLVYMNPTDSDTLITFFASRQTGTAAFVTLEQTGANDAFGRQMSMNISARGSPLLGLSRYPQLEDQRVRFERLGWRFVRAETMLAAFEKRVSREDAARLNGVELLDELEEWRLLMSHYCVTVATLGPDGDKLLAGMDLARYNHLPAR